MGDGGEHCTIILRMSEDSGLARWFVWRGRDLPGRYFRSRALNDSDVTGRGSCVGDLHGWHRHDGGNLMKVDVWGNDARYGGLIGGDLQDSMCTSGTGRVDFNVGYRWGLVMSLLANFPGQIVIHGKNCLDYVTALSPTVGTELQNDLASKMRYYHSFRATICF